MRIQWRDANMTAGKWLKALGVILGTFVLVYVVVQPVFQAYRVVHPRRWQFDLTEEMAGKPVERVTFEATDGIALAGWFVPGDGDGATIVSSHGLGANGPGTYPWVRFLNDAGYNVFMLDHRAHGQSGGRTTTLGPREVRDLRGAVAYLRSRGDVDPDRIGAFGCSMGSAVVIGAAAEDPAFRAVVAEAVFADMRELWHRFGYVGIRGTSIHWSWGKPMLWAGQAWTGERIAAYDPEELVARISPRPLFIIHSENDNEACTVADAHRLYEAARDPKTLWIVSGAGHCGALFAQPEEYERRVLAFYDRALRE